MTFLTLNSLVTDRFIGALCNTLVQSLWQGLVLAMVTGLVIISTRKASASMRYNLLIALLGLFTVGVGITFAVEFEAARPVVVNAPAISDEVFEGGYFGPVVTDAPVQQAAPASTVDAVKAYLNNHHNTIVLIWFLIICIKSMQFGVGLWSVNRLKNTQVTVNDYWTNHIQQLADKLAIKQSVALLQSALAKVPMVIGNLKPVILMPIGLLTALSTEEVEAILVHELAHIKRRDYLVNLLQSLMEIIFFFNPAVLWLSHLIKAERENCCDDLALAQSSSKAGYIRALVSCEEYQTAVSPYAMAFAGSKGTLLERVKRMTGDRNHSLNLFEKTVLAICLVVTGVCLTAFAEKETIKEAIAEVAEIIQPEKKDEMATETATQLRQQASESSPDPKKPTAAVAMGTSAAHIDTPEAYLSRRPLTAADTDKYNSPSARRSINMRREMVNDRIIKNYQDLRTFRLNDKEFSVNGIAQPEELRKKYEALIAENTKLDKIEEAAAKVKRNAFIDAMRKDGLISGYNVVSYDINKDEFIVNGVKQSEELRAKYFEIPHPESRYGGSSDTRPDSVRRAESTARSRAIIQELIKDGIVNSAKGFSYNINEQEFIVNGVKQPYAVHQKYFKLYQPTTDPRSDLQPAPPTKYQQLPSNVRKAKLETLLREIKKDGFIKSGTYLKSFTLNAEEFTINGVVMPKAIHQKYYAWQQRDTLPDNGKFSRPHEDVVNALLKDGIISTRTSLTFTLNAKEFIVNGVKQSDLIHGKYLGIVGDDFPIGFKSEPGGSSTKPGVAPGQTPKPSTN